MIGRILLAFVAGLLAFSTAAATLDRDIDSILRRTDVPSASIAVVRDGKTVYVKTYGLARLNKPSPARPSARYAVGSVSKQFTATAMLMLAEDGKLSLDDPIGKYLPGLTAGDRITIQQLLNHTAGYADYWPIDYVSNEQRRAVPPIELARRFATGPLDFQPGEDSRYCNTCYVIAGLIIEQVSGEPLERFLDQRIFQRLGIRDAVDIDLHPLGTADAVGYTRHAFGPPRAAPLSGSGWLFATGALAFTAEDLARWDIAMIDRTLLKSPSYERQLTAGKLNDGQAIIWGLGVQLGTSNGHKIIEHAGTVSGFTALNRIYPDDRDAIVVLTNADFAGSTRDAIVARIASLLLPADRELAADRAMYDLLSRGRVDNTMLTDHARSYFTAEVLADYRSSLAGLGDPISFTRLGKWNRGGMIGEAYNVVYPNRVVQFDLFKTHDGKYEEAIVLPPG